MFEKSWLNVIRCYWNEVYLRGLIDFSIKELKFLIALLEIHESCMAILFNLQNPRSTGIANLSDVRNRSYTSKNHLHGF
ncbi:MULTISPECIES: hypothetical protein [Nostocales]|uniref:Uncharacterized protein n=3 Tax=Nostocales TaxID=1161 RepID=A0A0C1RBQ4_9CYAN|nr:hypothetical protein [Tolypothrix bouteillei]KAF3888027.1 hypothetical protein DA73_0400022950 [Tolypothrix bouteillei VB521301]